MPNVGPLEIGLVLLVVLVIFGPKRLPDLGRSLGRGMREFKDSVTGKDKDELPSGESSTDTVKAEPADGERERAQRRPRGGGAGPPRPRAGAAAVVAAERAWRCARRDRSLTKTG